MAPGDADMGGSTLAASSRRSGGSQRSGGIGWPRIDHPPTPYKGMVWRSISHSLLYNMQGFKAAAAVVVIIIINPWYEGEAGEAGAPAHAFQHRRYAS